LYIKALIKSIFLSFLAYNLDPLCFKILYTLASTIPSCLATSTFDIPFATKRKTSGSVIFMVDNR
jgi:hypothetical protein